VNDNCKNRLNHLQLPSQQNSARVLKSFLINFLFSASAGPPSLKLAMTADKSDLNGFVLLRGSAYQSKSSASESESDNFLKFSTETVIFAKRDPV
jgi:hypothetical protein